MPQEKIKLFLDKLSQDEGFRESFLQIQDNEKLCQVLDAHGLPKDPQQFAKAVFQAEIIPIPDEALAAVSGGLNDKYDFKNKTGFLSFVGGICVWALNKTICKDKPLEYSRGQKKELEDWKII
jgi:hypothetical protein